VASGFIILRDGRCLSVRHAAHDAVLRSVAESLDEGSSFREWLLTQVPDDSDSELGYAFVRAVDGAHVERVLDLRCLTEVNRRLFEGAARRAEPVGGPRAPEEDVISALSRFRAMLDSCERGEPPLALSDWTCEAPAAESKIGPGWEGPA
jgi:hypothetical protein